MPSPARPSRRPYSRPAGSCSGVIRSLCSPTTLGVGAEYPSSSGLPGRRFVVTAGPDIPRVVGSTRDSATAFLSTNAVPRTPRAKSQSQPRLAPDQTNEAPLERAEERADNL